MIFPGLINFYTFVTELDIRQVIPVESLRACFDSTQNSVRCSMAEKLSTSDVEIRHLIPVESAIQMTFELLVIDS